MATSETDAGHGSIASSATPPGTSTPSPCRLAKLVVTILAPGATFFWAVDDTLCRKRGLTLYGTGMHYDPLISSHAKSLVSWGHDWVVLTLIVAFPVWAPSKVFALPIAMRLFRNRQGLTKGKKNPKGKKGQQKPTKPKHDPNHRTRPDLALEFIIMVTQMFPNDEIIVSGDSSYGSQSILSHLPPNVHLISHVHPNGALYEPAVPKKEKRKGPARKKGDRLPNMKQWADDPDRPWTKLEFDQFRVAYHLGGQDDPSPVLQGGKGATSDHHLNAQRGRGKRPDQNVLLYEA